MTDKSRKRKCLFRIRYFSKSIHHKFMSGPQEVECCKLFEVVFVILQITQKFLFETNKYGHVLCWIWIPMLLLIQFIYKVINYGKFRNIVMIMAYRRSVLYLHFKCGFTKCWPKDNVRRYATVNFFTILIRVLVYNYAQLVFVLTRVTLQGYFNVKKVKNLLHKIRWKN